MGNRDSDLLLAVTLGDTLRYRQLLNKLNRYAYALAIVRLPTSILLRDEAVEQAMNKVGDFFGKPDNMLRIRHPWNFAQKIIRNSLKDSEKTCRLEEIEITSTRDTIDREVLCYTDDALRKNFVKAADDVEDDDFGSGWRQFQIISEGKHLKTDDDVYHPHRNIELLRELFKYTWWQGINHECVFRLWGNYFWIMDKIDDISGPRERDIMKAYLAGFEQAQIAKDFGVSKQRVSTIVRGYLNKWEWDECAMYKARLILLTHYLATQYSKFKRRVDSIALAAWKLNDSRFEGQLQDKIEYLESLPRRDGTHYVAQLREKWSPFFDKVTKDSQASAYFGDIQKSDLEAFIDLCSNLSGRWCVQGLTF